MTIISSSAYTITNWHIDRIFRTAGLQLNIIKTDQYTIEYWDNGAKDKPVFLAIHGFGAKAKYQWYKQLSVLEKDYRIIIPNLMYFGRTRPHVDKYKVKDQVDMIQHFMKTLSIERYHLIGASYGGLISAELASQFPEQVEKLFLVDAAIKYIYEEDNERICKYFGVESVPELFVPSDPDGLKKLYRASIGANAIAPPTATLRQFHEELYKRTFKEKRALVEDLIEVRESYAHHVYSYDVKVHLIWGEGDMLIPMDRAVKLKEHIGGDTTLDFIKGGGHMPNMNKPRQFNKLLKKYLQD